MDCDGKFHDTLLVKTSKIKVKKTTDTRKAYFIANAYHMAEKTGLI
jgi:hypothetical protein